VLVGTLRNVARTHGQDVHLVVTAEHVTLTVTDDGVGMLPETGRRGLKNIDERARGMGGTLDVGPGPHGGTRLVWRVPLPALDAAHGASP
jgi:signal transduction histidine kinase